MSGSVPVHLPWRRVLSVHAWAGVCVCEITVLTDGAALTTGLHCQHFCCLGELQAWFFFLVACGCGATVAVLRCAVPCSMRGVAQKEYQRRVEGRGG